jgi:hypothetical protein
MRIVAVAALLLLGGCATAIRGSTEQVQFDSEPVGAEMRSIVKYPCGGPCPVHDDKLGSAQAYIGDDVKTPTIPGPSCITPCALQVARNQELIVTFTKAGYQPETLVLETRASSGAVAVAGNVLLGGAVGLVVDAGSGAGLDHYPNPIKALLRPLPAAAKPEVPPKKRR